MCSRHGKNKPSVPKNVTKFEAVTTLMSGNVGFAVSPDLYNSFDTLFIFFHMMNKFKTEILKNFCHKIFKNMLLSTSFWYSFG